MGWGKVCGYASDKGKCFVSSLANMFCISFCLNGFCCWTAQEFHDTIKRTNLLRALTQRNSSSFFLSVPCFGFSNFPLSWRCFHSPWECEWFKSEANQRAASSRGRRCAWSLTDYDFHRRDNTRAHPDFCMHFTICEYFYSESLLLHFESSKQLFLSAPLFAFFINIQMSVWCIMRNPGRRCSVLLISTDFVAVNSVQWQHIETFLNWMTGVFTRAWMEPPRGMLYSSGNSFPSPQCVVRSTLWGNLKFNVCCRELLHHRN